jgi:Phosphotransferase enzyme family
MDELIVILARYPQPVRRLNWSRLIDSGGLSGASVFRGDLGPDPLFCAKRYPNPTVPNDHAQRHHWLTVAASAGLSFVPRLLRTLTGETTIVHAGHFWELHDWMPGRADFAERPTQAKLIDACAAVIQLLDVWRGIGSRYEPSRAVQNRLALFAKWRHDPPSHSPYLSTSTNARARAAIAEHIDRAESQLLSWAGKSLLCQPCIRDLRHDHFLFNADRLTGLIDFGAANWDNPATDAARLLGELAWDQPELYELGLEQFSREFGSENGSPKLIRALDTAGTVGSLIHWLDRLQNPIEIPVQIVETRFVQLALKLERILI